MRGYSNKGIKRMQKNEEQSTSATRTKNRQAVRSKEAVSKERMLTNANFIEVFGNRSLKIFAKKVKESQTRTVSICLYVLYRDGNLCPPNYFKKSELRNAKVFRRFGDLDEMTPEDVSTLYESVNENIEKMSVSEVSGETIAAFDAVLELIEFHKTYGLKGKFEIKDDYMRIESGFLKDALNELGLKITRLKFKKQLKELNLLQTNVESAGHKYDYKIGTDWFTVIYIGGMGR